MRGVAQTPLRLREAAKLGFRSAWVPPGRGGEDAGLEQIAFAHLSDLVARVSVEAEGGATPLRRERDAR